MEKIYNNIKNDIVEHSDVCLSILGKVSKWKRSHYVILSDIITNHLENSPLLNNERKINLGVSISPITLQRFFENEYSVKTHNDLRFIKTLDKFCVFLGKFDLNTYIHESLTNDYHTGTENEIEKDFFEKQLIIDHCKSQFDAFKDLPLICTDKISMSVCKVSPLMERIRLYFEKKRDLNLILITENNRSNYEIYDITKICDEPELKVVKTREFWNLVFQDGGERRFVVNHFNTQFYFFKKFDNEWKIWDNYNPDLDNILKIN